MTQRYELRYEKWDGSGCGTDESGYFRAEKFAFEAESDEEAATMAGNQWMLITTDARAIAKSMGIKRFTGFRWPKLVKPEVNLAWNVPV